MRPIPITAALALVIAAPYTAYERIGTTANADVVESTENLAGGFLAVGLTDAQPGFVVLSELATDRVDVRVDRVRHFLAGTHTNVTIATARASWSRRLRGPEAVVIDKTGAIESSPIDWTLADFHAIRSRVDCSDLDSAVGKRCGMPFAELYDHLAAWPVDRVPEVVRAFLVPHARPRR